MAQIVTQVAALKYGSYSSDHPPLGPVCNIMPTITIGGLHLE